MKKVLVNTKLNLNRKDINEALRYLDEEYHYEVSSDDMYSITINYHQPEPEYRTIEEFHEYDLEDGSSEISTYTFAQWLDRYNITVYGLAKKSGITTAQLYGLTSGDRKLSNCTYDTVSAIAKAFDMNADQLISFIEE